MLNTLKKKIIDANIEYHTKFADIYDDQSHFLPENKKRVKKLLLKFPDMMIPQVWKLVKM